MDEIVFIEMLQGQLDEAILASEARTSRGVNYLNNQDVTLGPKYLIRLNFPLHESEYDWDKITPFLNDGNSTVCKQFLSSCNGFSMSWRFSAPGILLSPEAYVGPDVSFNIPLDLGTISYGSYPLFAPDKGYLLASLKLGRSREDEMCDIVSSDGCIVSGHFRRSANVIEEFETLEDWFRTRSARALELIMNDVK